MDARQPDRLTAPPAVPAVRASISSRHVHIPFHLTEIKPISSTSSKMKTAKIKTGKSRLAAVPSAPFVQPAESTDFNEVVNLLAVFSEATGRLTELEAGANRALLELIDQHKVEYAALQETCKQTEASLEALCRSHPEWFTAARSLKTPYGRVSFRNGASLSVRDNEATVKLLRAEYERTLARRQADNSTAIFNVADYVRVVELPNLEALEKLDDETLKKFMVTRVHADTFSVSAAAVNFGKVIKDAADPKRN